MSNPVPVPRITTPVPVSSMDCIQRGDPITNLSLDDQLLSTQGTLRNDAKLLWQQKLIPYRSITANAPPLGEPHTDTELLDYIVPLLEADGSAIWTTADAQDATPGGAMTTIPNWGKDYLWGPGIFRGINVFDEVIGPNVGLFPRDAEFAMSSWGYSISGGTIQPNSPVDPNQLDKWAVVMQLLCPNAFRPVKYELWTVTTRRGLADRQEGDPLVIPSPFPWSSSTDFAKLKSGVLNPGQTLTIPCPIGQMPQSPPAPGGFASPISYGAWEGWGVSCFIYFPPPP